MLSWSRYNFVVVNIWQYLSFTKRVSNSPCSGLYWIQWDCAGMDGKPKGTVATIDNHVLFFFLAPKRKMVVPFSGVNTNVFYNFFWTWKEEILNRTNSVILKTTGIETETNIRESAPNLNKNKNRNRNRNRKLYNFKNRIETGLIPCLESFVTVVA